MMNSAPSLDWKPGAGIVMHVDARRLPAVTLPPHATRIQVGGRPSYHVTLMRRRELIPAQGVLDTVWQSIASELATSAEGLPAPEFENEAHHVGDETTRCQSWVCMIRNTTAFEALRLRLVDRIQIAMREAGIREALPLESPRWHVTLANTAGGDPLMSPGKPPAPK